MKPAAAIPSRSPEVRVGISGWLYPPWRGVFYPEGLPHHRELEYASRTFDTVEINGTFYSLQRPESFVRWRDTVPEDFRFAVKGSRFITHMKRLAGVEVPLANFFASGLLALGAKLGPILWQLGPQLAFDQDRVESFLRMLPRTTRAAARLARRHDERVEGRSVTSVDTDRPLRHAIEPRHPSFFDERFISLLRRHGVALVFADTAGEFPYAEDLTADFVYIRLHGVGQIYVGGYDDRALDDWARKIRAWMRGGEPDTARHVSAEPPSATTSRDVYVYFDNDAKVRAPFDASNLARKLRQIERRTTSPAAVARGRRAHARARPASR